MPPKGPARGGGNSTGRNGPRAPASGGAPAAGSSRGRAAPTTTATASLAADQVEALRRSLFQDVPSGDVQHLTNATGGERYEGQVSQATGKRHGKGLLRWPNGNVYAGLWDEGAMSGDGHFYYAVEGDRYEGGFRADKKHGAGTYTFANGNSYTGEFAVDKRHGSGKYRWMCGDEYDGQWYEGRMHGEGVTTYANGNTYVGSFVEDRREGKGTLSCTDGLAYAGEWRANNRHGHGRLDFPSGDYYVGQWLADKKEGKGKDVFANGNSYDGEYLANAKHGTGTMTYTNGDAYRGGWEADKMHGRGVYTFANGFVYDGQWRQDSRHGFGVYTFPNGHVYEGHWAEDRRHGTGKLTLSKTAPENAGETYEGTWKDGKMDGAFTVCNADGRRVFEGAWSQGAPAGAACYHVHVPETGDTLKLAGSFTPVQGAKKGMGTIDPIPPALLTLVRHHALPVLRELTEESRMAAPSSSSAHVGPILPLHEFLLSMLKGPSLRAASIAASDARAAAHGGGAPSPDDGVLLLNRQFLDPTVARGVDAALRRAADEVSADAAAIHPALLEALQTVTAARANDTDASSEPGQSSSEPILSAADVERCQQEEADATTSLETARQRLLDAEKALASATAEDERLKKLEAAVRKRQQLAEQRRVEAAALAERHAAMMQKADAAETEATGLEETNQQLKSATLGPLEEELAASDTKLEALRAEVKVHEAAAAVDLKEAKKASADRAARQQAAAARAAAVAKAKTDTAVKLAKATSEAELLQQEHQCLREAQREAEAADQRDAQARQVEGKEMEARLSRLEAVCAELESEKAGIQSAVTKQRSKNATMGDNELPKRRLELQLLREELPAMETEGRALEAKVEALLVRQRVAAASDEASAQSRAELQRRLDIELLAAESVLKDAERALVAEEEAAARARTSTADGPEAAGHSGRGGAGAVGRLRRVRSDRPVAEGSVSIEIPPPAAAGPSARTPEHVASVAETVATLREEVERAKKRQTKKQRQLDTLHEEAREAAAAWLPSSAGGEKTVGPLIAAAREAQLHQVIKLRSQYERASAERDAAVEAVDVARGRAAALTEDDVASEGGRRAAAEEEDVEGEKLVRQILASMKTADRDWRVNYLVEQLEARKKQIEVLQRQAAYARELDRQVVTANSTITSFKQQHHQPSAPPRRSPARRHL